jgi:hypothetical protein
MEAFFSLLVAVLLLSFIPLTYDAHKFSRSSLIRYQQANDIAEVLWAAGDYERIGDWAEGDERAGEIVKQRIDGIAKEMKFCVSIEVKEKNKKIEVNCRGSGGKDVTTVTRTIVSDSGFYEATISVFS